MCEIFNCEDVEKLLYNKFVVIIGDSIQRGVYKDLVLLLQRNIYLSEHNLRNKGEMSFEHDELIEGGKKGKMTNGTNYQEVRQFQTDGNLIRFYFVCRCYSSYMESVLEDLSQGPQPDVVIMNSCLWDISRYGQTAIVTYKENLITLFQRFTEVLPENCLLIWNTTLPISKNARGGFIIPEIEFRNSTLRLDILEANYYVAQIINDYSFDVLDLHFYFRAHLHRRADDGIHWDKAAHRRITNLLLCHISDAWGLTLPTNMQDNQANFNEFRFGDSMNSCLPIPVSGRSHGSVNRNINVSVNRNINVCVNRNDYNLNEERFLSYNDNESYSNVRNVAYGQPLNASVTTNDNFHWQPYANDNHVTSHSRQLDNQRQVRYQPYNDNSYVWRVNATRRY